MLYTGDKTKGFVAKPTRLPVQSTQGKQTAQSPRIVRKVLPCLKERVRGGGFRPKKQLKICAFQKGSQRGQHYGTAWPQHHNSPCQQLFLWKCCGTERRSLQGLHRAEWKTNTKPQPNKQNLLNASHVAANRGTTAQ